MWRHTLSLWQQTGKPWALNEHHGVDLFYFSQCISFDTDRYIGKWTVYYDAKNNFFFVWKWILSCGVSLSLSYFSFSFDDIDDKYTSIYAFEAGPWRRNDKRALDMTLLYHSLEYGRYLFYQYPCCTGQTYRIRTDKYRDRILGINDFYSNRCIYY